MTTNTQTRTCNRCGNEKELTGFPLQKGCKFGRKPVCKTCQNKLRREKYATDPDSADKKRKNARKWIANNPDNKKERRKRFHDKHREEENKENRERRLKTVYGITAQDYDDMLKKQGGKCICGKDNGSIRLHIDHDHRTGKIRGLLCYRCNHAIGLAQDNPETFEILAQYLRDSRLLSD